MTVERCDGNAITVAETPERVVTLDGYAAQVMARLGLTDRIVGTGYPAPFTADTDPYRRELSKVPVLSERVPVTEIVAAQRPDLVLTGFSAFGGPPGSPKDSDLTAMGTVGLAACLPGGGGDATNGASGRPLVDLAPTYDFLRALGTVFRVPDRAERLIDELQERERAVAARTAPGPKPRVLVVQNNPTAGQPTKTSGTATIAHALITLAGGQNIFTDGTAMHADISPEEIVRRDPQVIWVITDYAFITPSGPDLVEQVRANPLLATTSAARQGRILSTSQYLVSFPTPLNLDALEDLANRLPGNGS
ncbi:ABC transporter substrate-binding protein [Plantactinospora sp. GCM10030261]|uniref:ABC transporter substrate-binding protein n=1 Tax=Plantactinospora sp. GCM10030261 TaxID=3273420 RepID=UPI0036086772